MRKIPPRPPQWRRKTRPVSGYGVSIYLGRLGNWHWSREDGFERCRELAQATRFGVLVAVRYGGAEPNTVDPAEPAAPAWSGGGFSPPEGGLLARAYPEGFGGPQAPPQHGDALAWWAHANRPMLPTTEAEMAAMLEQAADQLDPRATVIPITHRRHEAAVQSAIESLDP